MFQPSTSIFSLAYGLTEKAKISFLARIEQLIKVWKVVCSRATNEVIPSP